MHEYKREIEKEFTKKKKRGRFVFQAHIEVRRITNVFKINHYTL